MRRRLLLALALHLTAVAALTAQPPRRDEAALYEPLPPVRLETAVTPAPDGANGRLDVSAWLRPSALVFTRTPGDTTATPFAAAAEFAIEVADSIHGVRYRKFALRRVAASTGESSAIPDDPVSVGASVLLAPGSYSVALEVTDQESRRRLTRRQEVRVPAPGAGALAAGSLLLTGAEGVAFGTALPVGLPARGLLAVASLRVPDSAWTIVRIGRALPAGAGVTPLLADSVRPDPVTALPELDTLAGGRYRTGPPSAGALRTFTLALRTDTLPLGAYLAEITVRDGARQSVATQPLAVVWPGMPRALQSLRSAVRPLSYLLSPAAYAAMKDLDPARQRAAFEAFWRTKNPAPGNARNEVMGEFYRRVDAATQEFATIRQPDGAASDRGKFYILYGPPTSRERLLGTAAPPREVWTWASANRSLIFIDEKRTGDYVLSTEQ